MWGYDVPLYFSSFHLHTTIHLLGPRSDDTPHVDSTQPLIIGVAIVITLVLLLLVIIAAATAGCLIKRLVFNAQTTECMLDRECDNIVYFDIQMCATPTCNTTILFLMTFRKKGKQTKVNTLATCVCTIIYTLCNHFIMKILVLSICNLLSTFCWLHTRFVSHEKHFDWELQWLNSHSSKLLTLGQ